jgi:aspartate racemase
MTKSMRTIGLIGGTSWESTADYYALLNRGAAERLGPLRQPPIILHSVDFAELAALQAADRWDVLAQQYADLARSLVDAGATVLGICANSMHLVADQVREAAGQSATLVHIVDATAEAARLEGASRVALLGTAYTMEKPFYVEALRARGFDVVVPDSDERAELQRIIYAELTQGVVRPESRAYLLEVVRRCADRGAEAALLACTEFQMLVTPGTPDSALPLVDTTREHARALLDAALEGPA